MSSFPSSSPPSADKHSTRALKDYLDGDDDLDQDIPLYTRKSPSTPHPKPRSSTASPRSTSTSPSPSSRSPVAKPAKYRLKNKTISDDISESLTVAQPVKKTTATSSSSSSSKVRPSSSSAAISTPAPKAKRARTSAATVTEPAFVEEEAEDLSSSSRSTSPQSGSALSPSSCESPSGSFSPTIPLSELNLEETTLALLRKHYPHLSPSSSSLPPPDTTYINPLFSSSSFSSPTPFYQVLEEPVKSPSALYFADDYFADHPFADEPILSPVSESEEVELFAGMTLKKLPHLERKYSDALAETMTGFYVDPVPVPDNNTGKVVKAKNRATGHKTVPAPPQTAAQADADDKRNFLTKIATDKLYRVHSQSGFVEFPDPEYESFEMVQALDDFFPGSAYSLRHLLLHPLAWDMEEVSPVITFQGLFQEKERGLLHPVCPAMVIYMIALLLRDLPQTQEEFLLLRKRKVIPQLPASLPPQYYGFMLTVDRRPRYGESHHASEAVHLSELSFNASACIDEFNPDPTLLSEMEGLLGAFVQKGKLFVKDKAGKDVMPEFLTRLVDLFLPLLLVLHTGAMKLTTQTEKKVEEPKDYYKALEAVQDPLSLLPIPFEEGVTMGEGTEEWTARVLGTILPAGYTHPTIRLCENHASVPYPAGYDMAHFFKANQGAWYTLYNAFLTEACLYQISQETQE